MTKPVVTHRSVEDAIAENASAVRGPANRYRAMIVGGCDEDGEFENFLVVAENVTATDLMIGDGQPFAECFSFEDATTVANALNQRTAS